MFNRIIKFKTDDFSITELRIKFQVTKNLLGTPQLAEIIIYNLDSNGPNGIGSGGYTRAGSSQQ